MAPNNKASLRCVRAVLMMAIMFGLLILPTGASAKPPVLTTDESMIADILQSADSLDIDNPQKVFDYVLASLPPHVRVFPTENYYYFSFNYGGAPYAGNLRFDVLDRDAGKLHFAYFRGETPWMGASAVTHLVLDKTRNVAVEKLAPLVYRVTDGTASVVFELNDLSKVRMPSGTLLPEERYIGPVFDESGVRFFLVFNTRAKVFHYVLDASGPPADRFVQAGPSNRIRVGIRTGFAVYDDHRAARKLLIGVFGQNETLNTMLDGPFDQLPDNFIEGESLRSAILAAEPDLKGEIDRLGHFPGNEKRYLIAPYRRYDSLSELGTINACATAHLHDGPAYASCFNGADMDAGDETLRSGG